MKVHVGVGVGFPHLDDPDNIGEAALQVVTIDEHAKGEAGAFVAVYQLSDEPRT